MKSSPLLYQRPVRLLTLILILGMLLFSGTHMAMHYHAAKMDVFQRQQVYATALAENAERAFGEAMLTLTQAEDEVRRIGRIDQADEGYFHKLFIRFAQRAPQIGSIFLTDSTGRVVAHNQEYPLQQRNISDREFFQHQFTSNDDAPYFSRPYRHRIDGTWRFSITRRLNDPAGNLAGLIGVSIKMAYFEQIFQSFKPLFTERISLLRVDGYYQAAIPFNEETFQQSLKDTELFRDYFPHQSAGSFESPAYSYDQSRRWVSYKALTNAPLIASVSIEPAAAMAPWRTHAIQLGLINFFSAAVILWFSIRLTRQMRQYHQQLEATVQERTAELQKTLRSLEHSNRELEQFAYVASHDLQEPLRVVASFTQLLQQKYRGKLDADADEYIRFAVDGAKHMKVLIQDLLSYSRVTSKSRPFEAVDLNDTLGIVRNNLKLQIAECSAQLLYEELPTIEADPTQLVQLLQNLISNALKFRGSDIPQVRIGVQESDDNWQLCVSDNGIGIDPQHFQRIFLIFQRLHTRETYPGTGIGLAICRRIAEHHGGTIAVESQPGQGTTFTITLPKHH